MSDERLSLIARHEGFRPRLYRDSVGLWTIGYGHNVDCKSGGWCDDNIAWVLLSRGYCVSARVALIMLAEDVASAEKDVVALLGAELASISGARADALISMAFNLGRWRLSGFRKMWAAIRSDDWHRAAAESLNSKWASQVGDRANEIANMLRSG